MSTDDAADQTRLETHQGLDDADATRAEIPTGGLGPEPSLPMELRDRYEMRGILGSGRQAAVLHCVARESGDDVAIRVHSAQAHQPSMAVHRELSLEGRNAHVVHILAAGSNEHVMWQIQEYCAGGSLADVVQRSGGHLQGDDALTVLRQLTEALDFIHQRSIVHRDLKPTNILARSEAPLDLVLGDFGTALAGASTVVITQLEGTIAYASPEALYAVGGKASDWWALGITMHELLRGRHLFAQQDGRPMNALQATAVLGQGSYEHRLGDPRWDLLLDGLLHRDPDSRWRAEQVREWLDGGSPAVAVSHVQPATRREVLSFPFAGEVHSTPEELAAAMGRRLDASLELVERRRSDLRDWLHTTAVGPEADQLLKDVGEGAVSPEVAVVQLAMVLDPSRPPSHDGIELSVPGVERVAALAIGGDEKARAWIDRLRESDILLVAALGANDGRELARMNEEFRLSSAHADSAMAALRSGVDGPEACRVVAGPLSAMLLSAAVSAARAEELVLSAIHGAGGQPEALPEILLAGESSDAHAEAVARAAVSVLATPVLEARAKARAAQEERRRAEEAERERLASEERSRVAEEQRQQRQKELTARLEAEKALLSRQRAETAQRTKDRDAVAKAYRTAALLFFFGLGGFAWIPLAIRYLGRSSMASDWWVAKYGEVVTQVAIDGVILVVVLFILFPLFPFVSLGIGVWLWSQNKELSRQDPTREIHWGDWY